MISCTLWFKFIFDGPKLWKTFAVLAALFLISKYLLYIISFNAFILDGPRFFQAISLMTSVTIKWRTVFFAVRRFEQHFHADNGAR